MNKLFATVAIVVGIAAAGSSALHAAEDPSSNFGCGPVPVINDQRLLAALEGKKNALKEIGASTSDVHSRYERLKKDALADFSRLDEDLADQKLRHMACVLEKDPTNGLSSSERAALGIINGDDNSKFGPSPCACAHRPSRG